MKIKVAIIVDNLSISNWQKNALDYASDLFDIELILNCTNTKTRKSYVRNFAYYILNIFCLKNSLTKKNDFPSGKTKVVDFISSYQRDWQRIPSNVIKQIHDCNIKLVIKFGMSLLRIDNGLEQLDVLSFHHGDPEEYRGRPAGFYELYNHSDKVGVIVQLLSNKLDAGEVLARSYSKAYHHSYKKTALSFYSSSKYLLRKALINYVNKKKIVIDGLGKNYSLPSNYLVFIFLLKLSYRKLKRIFYGAFYEKNWNIAKLPFRGVDQLNLLTLADGLHPKVQSGYSFYADPFFSTDGNAIFIEALNSYTGLGEIVAVESQKLNIDKVLLKGRHFSYPFTFFDKCEEYLVPEVASHSAPFFLKKPYDLSQKTLFIGMENIRVVDGTLFERNGIYYYFCSFSESASDCLYLFHAQKFEGPYESHKLNPIVIDPRSARMGGRILSLNNKIYRFGQNNSYGYGDGIAINEITALSKDSYDELLIGYVSLVDASGPHTIDINKDSIALDYYTDQFSLFAGYRRFISTFLSKIYY